jgi:hypothetical protein
MTTEGNLTQPFGIAQVHEAITEKGYAVTSQQEIGLAEKCGSELLAKYFNSGALRRDQGDFPVDRERARDVILYEWHGSELKLEEYDCITIHDRSGIKGDREHKRIELLDDPMARQLIETFIRLVPEDRRQSRGTFGVNLFRTHTDVVTKPHQDDEEFIILHVLGRSGDGAVSYLYDIKEYVPDVPEKTGAALWQQLDPGDLMIFDDALFKHGATDLIPPRGQRATRDVLVCTIDYPSTYLERDRVPESASA